MNYYLDSNIFIRHLTKEPPQQAIKAKTIIQALETGKIKGYVSLLVVNEILWIMENFYEAPREEFVPELLLILNLRAVKPIEISKKNLTQTLSKFQNSSIDFTDLYLRNIAHPDNDVILSFDEHFDQLEIKRQEKI